MQPTIFLQIAGIEKAIQSGTWANPYSIDIPMSYVDLDDVADAAVAVLTEPNHLRATYELVGTDPMSMREMAALIDKMETRKIKVEAVPPASIIDYLPRTTVAEAYQADDLEHMFVYYNRHGLTGNSNVLEVLLKHKPNTISDYLKKAVVL